MSETGNVRAVPAICSVTMLQLVIDGKKEKGRVECLGLVRYPDGSGNVAACEYSALYGYLAMVWLGCMN